VLTILFVLFAGCVKTASYSCSKFKRRKSLYYSTFVEPVYDTTWAPTMSITYPIPWCWRSFWNIASFDDFTLQPLTLV